MSLFIHARRQLVHRVMQSVLNDEQFTQYWHYKLNGRFLNLKEPKTFNEKLHWLKLHYRHPLIRQCSDKLGVRSFAASMIPESHLVPLYSVHRDPKEFLYIKLPSEVAIKCNHGSGFNIIVKDTKELNRLQIVSTLSRWMKTDYSKDYREWMYQDIKPLVMCEKILMPRDADSGDLRDFKVFCFGGIATFIQVDCDRFKSHSRRIYDSSWTALPVKFKYPLPQQDIQKPEELSLMLDLASKLSAPFPFVRVDFYAAKDGVFLGEMSFSPDAGYGRFDPPEFDEVFGRMLDLPAPYANGQA